MSINPILKQRSDETYIEAIKILRKTGKCAILRPTGFGKTVVMCKISRRYKKILYIYPSEIIKQHVMNIMSEMKETDKINNSVTFCTYSYIGKIHSNPNEFISKLIEEKFDLIIFDEIHHMGANLVKKTLDILNYINPMKINILGGTATPDRMDGFDVIGAYFGNSIVSFYGVDNLIEDGLIPKPYYVYSTYGVKWAIDYIDEAQSKIRNTDIIVDLRKKQTQVAKMLNAPTIIKGAVYSVYNNIPPQYMKFLVFFSTKQILHAKAQEVKQWFLKAFPNYNVNEPIIVHSGVNERQNVGKVMQLEPEPNTIDLIFSINMLNEGYHTGNLTGCILLRPTQSQIVYTQQVGRCLQVGMENTPIILDFVENLHTHALYGVDTQKRDNSKEHNLEVDINRLNLINNDHIEIKNIVEEVRNVLKRIDDAIVTNNDTEMILDYRKKYTARAADIAKIMNIPLYQVIRVLHFNRVELAKLGLQLQDADRFETYNGNTGKEVDQFDEYVKQVMSEKAD